ncbi:MAG: hypothetical protein RJA70_2288 [Pseudomonadota bacterium]
MFVGSLLGVGLSLSAVGCGAGGASVGPKETLHRYANAVKAGDADGAYALLSEEARGRLSLPAFKQMLSENPGEVRELAEALTRSGDVLQITAQVKTADGDTLLLVYEGGAWRTDISSVDLYSQAAPLPALLAFVRAFEAKRYDVLMRFVPDAKREGLDAAKLKTAWEGDQKVEMIQLVSALRAGLPTARVELLAERATVSYGAGGTVQMLAEHGDWKIEEF